MKQKILKTMASLFLSVVLGFLCGYLVYTTYSKETKYLVDGKITYMLEYQKYNSYDSMKLANINNDYTYYKDDDVYYTIIGFTKNKNNIDKITSVIDGVNVTRCYIEDDDFNNQLIQYDKELDSSTSDEEIKEILGSMINYYNNNKIEILKIYN